MNASPQKLGNKKYLLKSIPYDPAHRADLFTLPSKAEALDRYPLCTEHTLYVIYIHCHVDSKVGTPRKNEKKPKKQKYVITMHASV